MKTRYEYRNGLHGARIFKGRKKDPSFFIYKTEIPELLIKLRTVKENGKSVTWQGSGDSRLNIQFTEDRQENGYRLERDSSYLKESFFVPEKDLPELFQETEHAAALAQNKETSLKDSRKFIKTPMGYLLLLISLMALAAGVLQLFKIQTRPVMEFNGDPVQIEGDTEPLHLVLNPTDNKKIIQADILFGSGQKMESVEFKLNKDFFYETDFLPLESGKSVFLTFRDNNRMWEEIVGGKRPKKNHLFILTTVTKDNEEPPKEILEPDRRKDFQQWYNEHTVKRVYYFILHSK